VGTVSEAIPNQTLFRLYAAMWLLASATVIMIAFDVSDLSDRGIAIYLGIGVALWAVDMAFAGRRSTRGHGLAHALLVAAFALVWPLTIVALVVALVVCFIRIAVADLRE